MALVAVVHRRVGGLEIDVMELETQVMLIAVQVA